MLKIATFPCYSKKQIPLLVNIIRFVYQTHYEVLKLNRNCSPQDIRQAFIKLTKQCHPDAAPQAAGDSHATMVRIVEAYSVLRKPDTRRLYDLSLPSERDTKISGKDYDVIKRAWADPSFHHNRNRRYDEADERKPYYGIKGVRRMGNHWVVLACVSFALLGGLLQGWVIWTVFNNQKFRREAFSRKTAADLAQARARSSGQSNSQQLQNIFDDKDVR